ncbi:hypothetical protein SY88_07090 [Clostridiales bacterium PH28_bin88]|nr:hypothetical protein SY88_07090 [Clostridiales bacterium PH28_bin88]
MMPVAWWLLIASWSLTRLALPGVLDLLSRGNALRPNYAGLPIPTAAGLALVVGSTLALAPVGLFISPGPLYYELLLAIWAMGLLGLLDDLAGSRDTRGLKGHLGSIWQGRLTTGGLKALMGGSLALILIVARGWAGPAALLDVLLVALATNTLNLMDLRPGRALKVFLVLALPLVWYGRGVLPGVYLLALVGAVIGYAPWDLRAMAMMGDTGSNALGMTLGLTASWLLPLEVKALLAAVLTGLHWYLERHSLSEVIEHNRLLRCLDRLGRPQVE